MVALCSEESFFVLRYNAEYDGEPDEVILCSYNCSNLRIQIRMVTKMLLMLLEKQTKQSKLGFGLEIVLFSQIL